jgi:putative ABC transport system permease protein
MLGKNPGFTLIAILTLALGIGANTAIFSVVNGVLLRALPFADAERLDWITIDRKELGNRFTLSGADFLTLKERAQSFEKLAAIAHERHNLTGGHEPERIAGMAATADFFAALGVQPALGRTFLPDEDLPGKPPVAVVSYSLWKRHLNADPAVLGSSLNLNDKPYTVVGVMPPEFKFLRSVEVWTILQLGRPQRRPPFYLRMIGKRKPGAGDAQVSAELEAARAQVEREYPDAQKSQWAFRAEPLKEYLIGDWRRVLQVLLTGVGFVLLIAIANVANLLLARAAAREKEVSVRAALGASRWRLIRQLLTESVLLAGLGGALGLLVAYEGVEVLKTLEPGTLPRLNEIGIDQGVLAFAVGIALMSGVLFGLAPALQISRASLSEALRESGRSLTETRGRQYLRGLLVVAQTALALVLLAGAGLMLRSLVRLQQVQPGFDPDGLLTLQLSLPRTRYPDNPRRTGFLRQLVERVQALPGVQAASISDSVPPEGLNIVESFEFQGQPLPLGQNRLLTEELLVGPDYFRALRIPLLQGRSFDESDNANAPPVSVINETMAHRFFPNGDAVGKRLRAGGFGPQDPWIVVVGVVGDVKYTGLAAEKASTIYLPYEQQPGSLTQTYLSLRAAQPASLTTAVRRAVQAIDKDLPIANVKTGEELLADAVGQRRFRTLLITVFAALALLLAGVGIYGVVSYSTAQRTQEIGIRLALGAQPRNVLGLMLRQGMKPVLAGVVIGLVAAFALTRLMQGLLFQVKTTDPATFAVIAGLLSAVALLACYVPARRATKVDPIVALRHE